MDESVEEALATLQRPDLYKKVYTSMNILMRYVAMEAGQRLRAKLARENPGVSMYGGFYLDDDGEAVLTVYAAQDIVVPSSWEEYPVHFDVR